jgi:hypothetical protein
MPAAGAEGLGRRGSLTPLGGGLSVGGSGSGGGGGGGLASGSGFFDGFRRFLGGNWTRFSLFRSRRRLSLALFL